MYLLDIMVKDIIKNGFKNMNFYSLQLDYHIIVGDCQHLLVVDILDDDKYYTTHISVDTENRNRYDWDCEVDLNRLLKNDFKLDLHNFPFIHTNKILKCVDYEVR